MRLTTRRFYGLLTAELVCILACLVTIFNHF
jgi:hypothetical protein